MCSRNYYKEKIDKIMEGLERGGCDPLIYSEGRPNPLEGGGGVGSVHLISDRLQKVKH